ncbi:LTA synthase family protein [Bdellovibrio bacteriovorus]|uniref:LTA synthase family protein n=1 Tax=Bdellovibrio bacteriovorus TaxID=959 RepID=UPI003AA91522
MRFLFSSLGFLLRITIIGAVFRAIVAIYLQIWDLMDFTTIKSTFAAFLHGWHFDLAIGSVFYLLLYWMILLFKLSPKAAKRWNFLFLWFYIVMIVTDSLYAKETGRHLSYEIYSLFTIEGSMLSLFGRYWIAVLVSLAAAASLNLWVSPNYKTTSGPVGRIFAMLMAAILAVMGFRGFEGIPQDPSWAYRAGGGPQGAFLALNGAYGIFWAAVGEKKSSKENIASPKDIDTAKIFAAWKAQRGIHTPIGGFDGNIVIVFLESWWGSEVDRIQDGVEILPFFNKLRRESLHTDLFLAGGHRTTEGIFSSMCSLPNPLGKSIMYSEIENKDFVCLPRLLTEKGYSSAFFQGSDQYTSGTGLLVLKTGFQSSYGKRDIPDYEKLEQNAWGVYDTDLYKFALDKMTSLREPFLVGINTNTTHDNLFPARADRQKYKTIRQWADTELQEFHKLLQSRKWEKDWLLVLVADHTTYGGSSIFDHYAIPFLMKHYTKDGKESRVLPNKLLPGAFSQPDIAATLADITGVKAPTFLGRSLARPEAFSPGASIFHLGQSAWFENDWAVVFNIRNPGEERCFKWKEDMSFTKESPCPANGKKMHEEGLSYIKESQEILFK